MGGQTDDPIQWTGVYIVTILVAQSDYATVAKCLPKGLKPDPSLIKDGHYPVVLLFGCMNDAMNRLYPFIGMNYLEVFSAIPGVYIERPDIPGDPFKGPYIYPYRGYLNRLLPCIFGWLASYPKAWKRVEYQRQNQDSPFDSFRVRPLFGGKPLVTAEFESDLNYEPLWDFKSRMDDVLRLISPNVIHANLLGSGFKRSSFDMSFLDSAVAWDLPNAKAEISDPDLFPGMTGKPHLWKGLKTEDYGAVRFAVAWRLVPESSKNFKHTPWPPGPCMKAAGAS
jgi:hypothetical protein